MDFDEDDLLNELKYLENEEEAEGVNINKIPIVSKQNNNIINKNIDQSVINNDIIPINKNTSYEKKEEKIEKEEKRVLLTS